MPPVTTQTAPLCFADTETTDIGPRRLAWELAIIRREPDGTRTEFQAFVEVDLSDANPYALSVGRFYDRHPLGQWLARGSATAGLIVSGPPRPEEFLDGHEFPSTVYLTARQASLAWCRWTHGCHIVGAVPNFDTEVMAAAVRAAGLTGGHHYHLIDVENLIVGYLRGNLHFTLDITREDEDRLKRITTPPWKSDDLFAEVGVTTPDEDRHTALGDARTCERVWDALYGGAA